jgi:hypothetical protein
MRAAGCKRFSHELDAARRISLRSDLTMTKHSRTLPGGHSFARRGFLALVAMLIARSAAGEEPPAPAPVAAPPAVDLSTEKPLELFDGRTLAGWRVLDEDWFKKHGPVAVADGEIVLAAGEPGTGVVWKGKPPRENYELTLKARRREGDDFFCGLTFPVGDEYCTLILGGWGGSATGLSNVDGSAAIENETTGHFEFKPDRWYQIRLRVTRKQIQAWVDKEELINLAREGRRFSIWWEQEPARPLGIVSWQTRAGLKEIQLRKLSQEEAAR